MNISSSSKNSSKKVFKKSSPKFNILNTLIHAIVNMLIQWHNEKFISCDSYSLSLSNFLSELPNPSSINGLYSINGAWLVRWFKLTSQTLFNLVALHIFVQLCGNLFDSFSINLQMPPYQNVVVVPSVCRVQQKPWPCFNISSHIYHLNYLAHIVGMLLTFIYYSKIKVEWICSLAVISVLYTFSLWKRFHNL